jgi:hypothetical protein
VVGVDSAYDDHLVFVDCAGSPLHYIKEHRC